MTAKAHSKSAMGHLKAATGAKSRRPEVEQE